MVRAGLERDVQRRSGCPLAGRPERRDLGVRRSRTFVPALAHHSPPRDHHSSDERIGRRHAETPMREREGAGEVYTVHAGIRAWFRRFLLVQRDLVSHTCAPVGRGGETKRRAESSRAACPLGRAPVGGTPPFDCSRPPSPIPTLTVGPGIPPGPPLAGSQRVADCHRRWGLAPRPEDELFSLPSSICAGRGTEDARVRHAPRRTNAGRQWRDPRP